MSRHCALALLASIAIVGLPHGYAQRPSLTTQVSALDSTSSGLNVSIPKMPPTSSSHVVDNNFLGISFELSFVDQYFGNSTTSIPPTMLNYISALRLRTGTNHSVRLRIGGNSMDSSTYIPTQKVPMINFTNPKANVNNEPVNFGPPLFEVMKTVDSGVGGAQYLLGLSLHDPNSTNVPLLAGAAQQTLGNSFDAFLLGNEPDLYFAHGQRKNMTNYTVSNYISDFWTASQHLTNTSAGNLLNHNSLGGPTICCSWDLATVLKQGYLAAFDHTLKYITLQHYPQNNCFGRYSYGLPYYTQHSNVISLATWQRPGIDLALSNSSNPGVVMTEFNSASCGGIPNISDTFAVGSLWTADYALQMAAVGYSAAYLHTREPGVSYNVFDPPTDGKDDFTTKPGYYALLAVAEALQTNGGNIVVDLNVANATGDANATVAGYGIYDAQTSNMSTVVLFNYGNSSAANVPFALPATIFPSGRSGNITVKYLSAAVLEEKTFIGWGGKTLAGVADGNLISTPANATGWAVPNQQVDCGNGCTVNVPGPSMAVVFINSGSPTSSVVTSHPPTNGHVGQATSLGQVLVSAFAISIASLIF